MSFLFLSFDWFHETHSTSNQSSSYGNIAPSSDLGRFFLAIYAMMICDVAAGLLDQGRIYLESFFVVILFPPRNPSWKERRNSQNRLYCRGNTRLIYLQDVYDGWWFGSRGRKKIYTCFGACIFEIDSTTYWFLTRGMVESHSAAAESIGVQEEKAALQ